MKKQSIQDRIKSIIKPGISTVDLQTNLNTINAQLPLSDSDSLLLCSILLEKLIPQTFNLMDDPTKNVVYNLLNCQIGFNQLIRLIRYSSKNEFKVLYIQIFVTMIDNKVDDLVELLYKSEGSKLRQLKGLLISSIVDTLGFIIIWTFDNPNASIDRKKIGNTQDKYILTLFTSVLKNTSDNKIVNFEHIQTSRDIISCFINEHKGFINSLLQHWEYIKLYEPVPGLSPKKGYQQLETQKKFIKGFYSQMNEILENNKQVMYWDVLVKNILNTFKVENNSTINREIYALCENNSNILVTEIWINSLTKPKTNYIYSLIENFGKLSYIMNTNLNSQANHTKYIILLLKQLSTDELVEISSNSIFLNTITHRLESKGSKTRELGMILADYIYFQINGKFMFTVPSYSDQRDDFLKYFNESIGSSDQTYSVEESLKSLTTKNDKLAKLEKSIEEVMETSPVVFDFDYDSDEEDSDLEDPSVSRKPYVAKPVFLKDLVYYLTCEKDKDTDSYEKKSIGFKVGIEMIRVKQNTPEMKYYCKNLIDCALNLDDFGFPIDQSEEVKEDDIKVLFDSWKLSFIIALCTSEPDICFDYLLKNFIKQDWSVPTRVQALTAIGLSCRELCGRKDSFVLGKGNLDKFKSKKLNGPGHKAFLELDTDNHNKIVDLDQQSKEAKLLNALENVEIGEGKIVRKSRKLDIDKKNKEISEAKVVYTTFINKKLPKLYFSLVTLWQEVNIHTYNTGFKIGSMSEYLNSHYIDIMSMVYSCGIPSCVELIEMSAEQISTFVAQLKAIQIRNTQEFPSLLFNSITKGICSLLIDNDRTLMVLKNVAAIELTMLFEVYTVVLADCPARDEETKNLGFSISYEMQKYILSN